MSAPEVRKPGWHPAIAEEQGTGDAASLPEAEAWRTAVAAADKRFTTLRAKFALAGFEVHVCQSATGEAEFLVSRWGLMTAAPRTLAELEAFAAQVGAL